MKGAPAALAFVALLAVVAVADVGPATQQDVEESLTCQCGCGLTVHACNHLQCSSGEPIKAEIKDRLGRGDTKEQILETFRTRFGEKVLSSPNFRGFNVLAWITPFAAVIVMAGVLAFTIRRRSAIVAARPPAPAARDGDPLRDRLAKELARLDDE